MSVKSSNNTSATVTKSYSGALKPNSSQRKGSKLSNRKKIVICHHKSCRSLQWDGVP